MTRGTASESPVSVRPSSTLTVCRAPLKKESLLLQRVPVGGGKCERAWQLGVLEGEGVPQTDKLAASAVRPLCEQREQKAQGRTPERKVEVIVAVCQRCGHQGHRLRLVPVARRNGQVGWLHPCQRRACPLGYRNRYGDAHRCCRPLLQREGKRVGRGRATTGRRCKLQDPGAEERLSTGMGVCVCVCVCVCVGGGWGHNDGAGLCTCVVMARDCQNAGVCCRPTHSHLPQVHQPVK